VEQPKDEEVITLPFADNQGIQIHYQVLGTGEPLIMQHGFFSSGEDWHEFGYVEKLREICKLILVDARGHGTSSKPHDPESYALENSAADVAAVLDSLGLNAAHYLGYSMGGWIGFGMAKFAPARLKNLIIGGAQPYGKSFTNARKILGNGIDAWISEISQWGPYSPEAIARYRKNDAQALLAAAQDRPDISDILPTMTMPCFLYAGDADNEHAFIKQAAEALPNATFSTIPDCNHIETFVHGHLVMPQLIDFLTCSDR